MSMKGILWKWTNYWMGWQPRWFILDVGILSYYSSEEEVTQGCKGSVCVAACNINVHPTDNLRLDIVIPSEKHMYVRASSTLERQQWLVAIGTAKSHGVESILRKSSVDSTNPDTIKVKKSELRLYCDLLMQLAHSIKEAATSETIDVAKLDECTGLLSDTCETFISTLEDCVKVCNSISPITTSSSSVPLMTIAPTANVSKTFINGTGLLGNREPKVRPFSNSQDQ